jgi:hypothetical protein
VHCVVEIGIGDEAAVQLQARDNALKEDAALLNRHALSGGPDDPKLQIAEGERIGHALGDTMDVNCYPANIADLPNPAEYEAPEYEADRDRD